jgi:hypothetical protein
MGGNNDGIVVFLEESLKLDLLSPDRNFVYDTPYQVILIKVLQTNH